MIMNENCIHCLAKVKLLQTVNCFLVYSRNRLTRRSMVLKTEAHANVHDDGFSG